MLKSNPDGLLKIQELKDALAEQKKINFELNEKRNEMNETMDKLVETVKKKEAIEVELREKLADIEEAHNYLLQSLKYTQKSLEYKKHDIYKLENINSALKKMLENDEETAGPEAQQTAVKNSVGSSSSVQIQAKETSVLANVAPEAETVNLAREQKKALDTPSKVLNRCRIFQLAIKQLPQYDQNKHSALDKSFSNILDSNLPQKVSTNPFDDNYFEASSSTSKHAALSSKPENVPIDGYTGESFEELSEATLGMPKKNRVLKFKSKFWTMNISASIDNKMIVNLEWITLSCI